MSVQCIWTKTDPFIRIRLDHCLTQVDGTHLGMCSAFPGKISCNPHATTPRIVSCPETEWGWVGVGAAVGCIITGQEI